MLISDKVKEREDVNKEGCEGMTVDEEATLAVSSSSAVSVECVPVKTGDVSVEGDVSVVSASTVDVGSGTGD